MYILFTEPYVYLTRSGFDCSPGEDFHSITAEDSVDNCKAWCNENSACKSFVLNDTNCHFKNKYCDLHLSDTATYYKKYGR